MDCYTDEDAREARSLALDLVRHHTGKECLWQGGRSKAVHTCKSVPRLQYLKLRIGTMSRQDKPDGMRRPVSHGMRYAPNDERARSTIKGDQQCRRLALCRRAERTF